MFVQDGSKHVEGSDQDVLTVTHTFLYQMSSSYKPTTATRRPPTISGRTQKSKHPQTSVFTPLPELQLSDSNMTNNTPRHNYCLEILTSGCVNSFSEFFKVTAVVDWSESAADQAAAKQKEMTPEDKRRRDLYISLPYLKDNLCQAETSDRENNFELVFDSFKKIAAFFNGIGDVQNSLRFYTKALEFATKASLPTHQAEACLQLAKGNQALDLFVESIGFYERYDELISQCGTDEEQQTAKEYLMSIYEQMANKLESQKQHLTSHTQSSNAQSGFAGGRTAKSALMHAGVTGLSGRNRASVQALSLQNLVGNLTNNTRRMSNATDSTSESDEGFDRLTSTLSTDTSSQRDVTTMSMQSTQSGLWTASSFFFLFFICVFCFCSYLSFFFSSRLLSVSSIRSSITTATAGKRRKACSAV